MLVTLLDYVELWDKAMMTSLATCLYQPSDCNDTSEYNKADSMMNLALATKLHNKVEFVNSFLAAKLAVNRFNNNCYVLEIYVYSLDC